MTPSGIGGARPNGLDTWRDSMSDAAVVLDLSKRSGIRRRFGHEAGATKAPASRASERPGGTSAGYRRQAVRDEQPRASRPIRDDHPSWRTVVYHMRRERRLRRLAARVAQYLEQREAS